MNDTIKRIIGALVVLAAAAAAGWMMDRSTPDYPQYIDLPVVVVLYGAAVWGLCLLLVPHAFWPKS